MGARGADGWGRPVRSRRGIFGPGVSGECGAQSVLMPPVWVLPDVNGHAPDIPYLFQLQSVRGTVVDEQGSPVGNQEVEVFGQEGQNGHTKTGAKGEFVCGWIGVR